MWRLRADFVSTRLRQRIVVGAVGHLPRSHAQGDGLAVRIAADVELGREATARTARTRPTRPALPPAAPWCARMPVLSIICRRSASPPPSARAYSIGRRGPTPSSAGTGSTPNSSLRFRPAGHATARRCARSRRWGPAPVCGRGQVSPPNWLAEVTKAWKKRRASSLTGPRITADFQQPGSAWNYARAQPGLHSGCPRRPVVHAT